MRVGVIRNPRSHGNRRAGEREFPSQVLSAEPTSLAALDADLARFAAAGVDALVIDGGDGTVRDVLSALPTAFAEPPLLAVLPSGKTNVLALDLGARRGAWTLEAVLSRLAEAEAEAEVAPAIKTRSPLEATWTRGERAPIRGFVFGVGAFVRATRLSQSVHRLGAFHSLSVALTLTGAAMGALFGGARAQWRQGAPLRLQLDDAPPREGERFLTLATTLKRLPLGLRPFGPPRDGLKVLDVDAPPRRLHAALPILLRGGDAAWLEPAGYRRGEASRLGVTAQDEVVIDGEIYPGGEIVIRRLPPLRFLAP